MGLKTLSIIGSTGSIGTQALGIVRSRPDDFKIKALSAGKNLDLLIEQIKEFKPEYVSILSDEDKKNLQELFPEIQVLKNIEEIAALEKTDIFLSAIVGIAGLKANLIALKHAKRVAIANKETLVAASHLVDEAQAKYQSELLPVDSEHVAIHQCLQGKTENIEKILLTASGGPFRNLALEEFKNIQLKDALKHPTWTMGSKITIDSSTMMNKGLEIIEVNALFKIAYEKIQVLIHPQSIIHSGVSFNDGNSIMQLSSTDMKVPIQYALDFPEKNPISLEKSFDIFDHPRLEFEKPDFEKFPALRLALEAGKKGHSYPVVLNSANEAAVALFLEQKIHYIDICKIIENCLEQHQIIHQPSLDEIINLNNEINNLVKKIY